MQKTNIRVLRAGRREKTVLRPFFWNKKPVSKNSCRVLNRTEYVILQNSSINIILLKPVLNRP